MTYSTPTPKEPYIEITVTHEVTRGEYLLGIAEAHSTSLKNILKLNPMISNINLIYPRDEVVIRKENITPSDLNKP